LYNINGPICLIFKQGLDLHSNEYCRRGNHGVYAIELCRK